MYSVNFNINYRPLLLQLIQIDNITFCFGIYNGRGGCVFTPVDSQVKMHSPVISPGRYFVLGVAAHLFTDRVMLKRLLTKNKIIFAPFNPYV